MEVSVTGREHPAIIAVNSKSRVKSGCGQWGRIIAKYNYQSLWLVN